MKACDNIKTQDRNSIDSYIFSPGSSSWQMFDHELFMFLFENCCQKKVLFALGSEIIGSNVKVNAKFLDNTHEI